MTYSPVSMPRQAGLGLDVVYHNDKTGQDGVAQVGIGPYCDDACGLQTMLLLMDQYPGPVDCAIGPNSRASLVSYGMSRGIPYNPESVPQGPICAALIADYEMSYGKGSSADGAQCPPGQWGMPPLCFGDKTIEQPATNLCPEGSYGHPPYCVSVPGSTPATPPTGGTHCPTGTVGMPPNCYGLPGGVPALPPTTIPPHTTPPVVAPPKTDKPTIDPPDEGPGAWWAARSYGERIALGVAGAAVLVGGAALLIPSKRKRPAARPNRRRR